MGATVVEGQLIQLIHGPPAEPKQISQTSDSSREQTTCTCCINPVLLVYFYLVSLTPLCSIINTQCPGETGFLHLLYIFVAKRVRSSLPHPSLCLLEKWSSEAVTSALCSRLDTQLELSFTEHYMGHFQGFFSLSPHNSPLKVTLFSHFMKLSGEATGQHQPAWMWGTLLEKLSLGLTLLTRPHVLETLRLGRATVWGRQSPKAISFFTSPSSSGPRLLNVSSQMLPRFLFLCFEVEKA